MTQIMTAEGWKPLYDTAPIWKARHDRLDAARETLNEAKALPRTTERERDFSHDAIMGAYRDLEKAQHALIGADC